MFTLGKSQPPVTWNVLAVVQIVGRERTDTIFHGMSAT